MPFFFRLSASEKQLGRCNNKYLSWLAVVYLGSGQRTHLLIGRSEFKSRWSLEFLLLKILFEIAKINAKVARAGPLKTNIFKSFLNESR